jgi:DNA invertase Pin-like site-specific DNA recombinase
MGKEFVAYYRVSTHRQGASGLGLEAQREDVARHLAAHGGQLLAAFTEVESGRKDDRQELQKAISVATRAKAALIVAKLDRLARKASFLHMLMDSGLDLVFCDNPHANRLTIHILAAVAQDEAERTSQRTKAALAAAKRRGVKLGASREGFYTPEREAQRQEGLEKARAASLAVRQQKAAKLVKDVGPTIAALRAAGHSLNEIARHLNQEGQRTPRGKLWRASQVSRLCEATS